MLEELIARDKVVGVKQSRKAIAQGRAAKAFFAADADPAVVAPLSESCGERGVPVETGFTMAQLGAACRISVGAAVVVLLRKGG